MSVDAALLLLPQVKIVSKTLKVLPGAAVKIVVAANKGFVKAEKAIITLSNKSKDLAKLNKSYLKNTRYHQKVIDQMKLNDYHSFPLEVDNCSAVGRKTKITGGMELKEQRLNSLESMMAKQVTLSGLLSQIMKLHRLFVPTKRK